MKFPFRTTEHVKETASGKALIQCLPEHWVLRHITERDYGLDCIVEITKPVDGGYELHGHMVGIQLKSDSTLNWVSKSIESGICKKATVSEINMSTVRYWLGLPFPVFLCVHDQISGPVHFAPVKYQAREQYNLLFTEQNTMSFYLDRDMNLDDQTGVLAFLLLSLAELKFDDLANCLKNLATFHEQYCDFASNHLHRHAWQELDENDAVMLFELLRMCSTIIDCSLANTKLISMTDILIKEQENFPNSTTLHEYTAAWAIRQIVPVLFEILEQKIPRLFERHEEYWNRKEYFLMKTFRQEWTKQSISDAKAKIKNWM